MYKYKIFAKIYDIIIEIYKEDAKQKILVEFITVASCKQFYKYLLEKGIHNINCNKFFKIRMLIGEDNFEIKEETLQSCKEENPVLLVSTQCIESGVDIDMDYGFKDISYLENEEQFLGRVRRNYNELKDSKVWFFNLDEAEEVYCNKNMNFRTGTNLLNLKYRKIFLDKNFDEYFNKLIDVISKYEESSINGISKSSFNSALKELDFATIKDEMMLIKNNSGCYIYVPFRVYSEKFNDYIDGKAIWEQYKNINKIKKYSSRFIEKQNLLAKMTWFIYELKYINNNIVVGPNKKEILMRILEQNKIEYEIINGIFYLCLNESQTNLIISKEKRLNIESIID